MNLRLLFDTSEKHCLKYCYCFIYRNFVGLLSFFFLFLCLFILDRFSFAGNFHAPYFQLSESLVTCLILQLYLDLEIQHFSTESSLHVHFKWGFLNPCLGLKLIYF